MSDPWGTPPPTVDLSQPTARRDAAYRRGVAQVGRARPASPGERRTASFDEPTPVEPAPTRPWQPEVRVPVRRQVRRLRLGGEWTSIGALFAFVCWGIWAISGRGGDLTGPVLAFLLVLVIAAGVFTLSRLIGRVVLERSLHRVRRSAWGSHLATGLFLFAAGIAYLGQTTWVVDAWTWFKGLFY